MAVELSSELKKAWKVYKKLACSDNVRKKDRRDFLAFVYPKIKRA